MSVCEYLGWRSNLNFYYLPLLLPSRPLPSLKSPELNCLQLVLNITPLLDHEAIMVNGCGQTEAAPHPTPGIKQKTCSHSITKPKFSLEEVLFPSVTGSGHSAQAIRVGSTTFTYDLPCWPSTLFLRQCLSLTMELSDRLDWLASKALHASATAVLESQVYTAGPCLLCGR